MLRFQFLSFPKSSVPIPARRIDSLVKIVKDGKKCQSVDINDNYPIYCD